MAYDRLFRREMLAKKDLNWSVPNPRLYSEAFTGRAKRHPQCPHCLSEDHAGAGCPHNPTPPFLGWFQGTPLPQESPKPQWQPLSAPQPKPGGAQDICRNFNGNRCRFTRCRLPAHLLRLLRTTCSHSLPPAPNNPSEPGGPGSESHLQPGMVQPLSTLSLRPNPGVRAAVTVMRCAHLALRRICWYWTLLASIA